MGARELAHAIGVSTRTVDAIEDSDGHSGLTLHQVGRLAEALAVAPEWLLAIETDRTPLGDEDTTMACLGSLLAAAGEPVPLGALIEGMGKPQGDVKSAIAALDRALRPCGMRVHSDSDGAVSVSSDPSSRIDPASLRRVLRAASGRRELDRVAARIIYGAITGTLTFKNVAASRPGHARLWQLVAAGIIVQPGKQKDVLQLTPEAEDSLRMPPEKRPSVR